MLNLELPRDVLKGWKVLVVDDEPDSLDVATLLLEMYGATVFSGVNGIDGLEKATSTRPDFIISDLSMPKMSGWEMLERLKSERSTLDIPVIALTAHAMDGDRNRAIAAGFHNYLSKPLQPETFVTDLLSLLIDIPSMAEQLNDRIGKETQK
jgi:two-component system cell cycle response regulator